VFLLRRHTALGFVAPCMAAALIAIVDSCGRETPAEPSSSCLDSRCMEGGRSSVDAGISDVTTSTDGLGEPQPNDAAGTGFTQGWVRVPWAPKCPLYQPGSPSVLASVSALRWQPCSTGRLGCQELAIDWGTPAAAQALALSATNSPGGGARIAVQQDFSTSGSQYQSQYAIWDSDKGFVAAWRHDGDMSCLEVPLGDVSLGETAVTLAVFPNQSVPTTVSQYLQVVGPAESLTSRLHPDFTFCNDLGFGPCPSSLLMAAVQANDSIVAMYFDQINAMAVRNRGTGADNSLRASDGGARTVWGDRSLVGGSVFYSDGSVVYVWSASAGERVLVAPTTAMYEHDVATDGTWLAWVESSNPDANGQFQNSTLFVSPYAGTAAQVTRRVLLNGVCPTRWCDVRVGNGFALVKVWKSSQPSWNSPGNGMRIIRIADGASWLLAPTGPHELWSTGYAIAGQIWVPSNLPASNGQVQTLQQISIDSLGAADFQ